MWSFVCLPCTSTWGAPRVKMEVSCVIMASAQLWGESAWPIVVLEVRDMLAFHPCVAGGFFSGKICWAFPRFPPDVPPHGASIWMIMCSLILIQGMMTSEGMKAYFLDTNRVRPCMSAPLPQQTWDVCPVLFWYWASVVVAPAVDDGPTTRQRWLDVPCLLGSQSNWQVTQRRPSTLCFYSTLWRRSPYQANDSAIAVAWHWHNPANRRSCRGIVLMLGQPRRRWTDIKATLGQSIVFARNTMLV